MPIKLWQEKFLMRKKNKEPKPIIYNKEQRFYSNVLENAKAAIEQMENSIKLQKDIIIMAKKKITMEDEKEKEEED